MPTDNFMWPRDCSPEGDLGARGMAEWWFSGASAPDWISSSLTNGPTTLRITRPNPASRSRDVYERAIAQYGGTSWGPTESLSYDRSSSSGSTLVDRLECLVSRYRQVNRRVTRICISLADFVEFANHPQNHMVGGAQVAQAQEIRPGRARVTFTPSPVVGRGGPPQRLSIEVNLADF